MGSKVVLVLFLLPIATFSQEVSTTSPLHPICVEEHNKAKTCIKDHLILYKIKDLPLSGVAENWALVRDLQGIIDCMGYDQKCVATGTLLNYLLLSSDALKEHYLKASPSCLANDPLSDRKTLCASTLAPPMDNSKEDSCEEWKDMCPSEDFRKLKDCSKEDMTHLNEFRSQMMSRCMYEVQVKKYLADILD